MKQCAQGSFHEARGKHAKKIKMVAQQEERLSEAVRKIPVLYDKAGKYYSMWPKRLIWKMERFIQHQKIF